MIKSVLPPVLAHYFEGDEAHWQLQVPVDYPAFAGHFPGYPVLPGVVQLDWAIRFGCQQFGYQTAVAQLEVLKFQQLIQPGMQVLLSIQHLAEKRKLQFSFSAGEQRFASGRIAFALQERT
ncbi:3-hydroxyacyl-ACP dehydratase FabZ family protein [Shewanella dokdonensis]|uniref:Thioester dehydrase n=1 Tax=Shewanella dokdonensis TaxID=712036 RepID=A0ABX8DAI2_9GAMM|nr:thioester dehydrase [Shewanella dokdonensis]MCL1075757.1 thioester dehydrase [Shewanella dokdonensis]QVK21902.1 thioester dehydrase [Shewanella dokdonensis]